LRVDDLDLGDLHRRRQQEVHEGRGEGLALVVIDDPLVERPADPLGDTPVNLPLDDARVHHGAAIMLDYVPEDLHAAGVDVDLHEPGRDPERLVPDLPRGDPDRVAARDEAAAGEGAGAPVELPSVAGDDRDVGGVAPERVGGNLGECRVVSLALGGEAGGHVDLAARLDADLGSLVRPDARALHVAADPEAEVAPLAPRLRLAAAEVAGADALESQLEAERVVAAVVAGGAAILEGPGSWVEVMIGTTMPYGV